MIADKAGPLPGWVPDHVRRYLDHTAEGLSLRELARRDGLHASTVLRQIRRCETAREDPLVDEALQRLRRPSAIEGSDNTRRKRHVMSAPIRSQTLIADETVIEREARRILRRLSEPGAVLAIASDLERAAVLRPGPDGQSVRTAVVDRAVAQAFALKDWIACRRPGRVASYEITAPGRAALRRMIEADARPAGLAEAATPFADQHRVWGERTVVDGGGEGDGPRRVRVNLAESPVAVLARRREKDGKPFLTPDLVAAAERLREDFELAQMGPRVAQNWDRFLTPGDRGAFRADGGPAAGPAAARDRVAAALRDLGPGLGDVILRCCCFLEGLEVAERRMGWSARSAKIVLRIALIRLRRHYDEQGGRPMIG
jgi:hypothetical protein